MIRCDSCEAAVINGHFCHEQGCPAAWRDEPGKCKECGVLFKKQHRYDSQCEDCLRDLSESYLEDLAREEHERSLARE